MKLLSRAGLLVSLVLVACGGDGQPNDPGTGGDGSMSATIDGQAWTADADGVVVSGGTSATPAGAITISGVKMSTGVTVSLILAFVTGPDNYPLGVNVVTNPGGVGQVSQGANGWITPLSGSAGSVTITARTATRIAGTFFFTGSGLPGMNPATKTVTNGTFDVTPASGSLPPLPTHFGSKVVAVIDGVPWNAATVVALTPGPGTIGVSASSTDYSLNLTPLTSVASGMSYGIPSQVSLLVVRGADSWTGGNGADVGSVTFTLLTASRARATFSGTLPKSGGGSPLVITGGVFNVETQ